VLDVRLSVIEDSQEAPTPAVTYQPVLDLGIEELFFEASAVPATLASSALAIDRGLTEAVRIRDPRRRMVARVTWCISETHSAQAVFYNHYNLKLKSERLGRPQDNYTTVHLHSEIEA
jgi:hypothetical protein